MKLRSHLIVSAAAGGVLGAIEGDPKLIGITMAAGVLPDADHLFDYYNWYIRRSYDRIFLLLHGWEYFAAAVAVYTLVFTEPWMLAIAIGYATQIGGDQIFNHARWNTYLWLARALNRFHWQGITSVRPADRGADYLIESVPLFKGYVRRWLDARGIRS